MIMIMEHLSNYFFVLCWYFSLSVIIFMCAYSNIKASIKPHAQETMGYISSCCSLSSPFSFAIYILCKVPVRNFSLSIHGSVLSFTFLFFFFELACIDNIIKNGALNNRDGTKNELSKLLYIYRPEKNATKLLITVANNTSRTNEIQWHWISLYGPDEHENKTNERRTRYKFVTWPI